VRFINLIARAPPERLLPYRSHGTLKNLASRIVSRNVRYDDTRKMTSVDTKTI